MKTQNSKTLESFMRRAARFVAGLSLLFFLAISAQAQIDPAPRQLLHLGVDTSLHGQGPMGAYAFYYWNQPNVPTTNMFLRLAIAPVYVDSELGFKGLLGEHTDLAVGAFGGLYANSYQEVDGGNWKKDESYDGNGGGGSVSVYHRFNPEQQIPLTGVLRETMNYNSFSKTSETGDQDKGSQVNDFVMPQNQPILTTRTGFRWGGKEPMLGPTLAMEISGWYEWDHRTDSGGYGYVHQPGFTPYALESDVQRLFGRAQINYTTLKSQHYIILGVQGGAAFNADRLGAYRLGGMLPYTKEFPLTIPGYYYQEISAQDFGMIYGSYAIPFGGEKNWAWLNSAAAALVKYIDGTGQGGALNSGVGTGIVYTSDSKRWRIMSLFGYGIEAKRGDDRGGYSLALAFQYNFGDTTTASDKAYQQLQAMDADSAHGVTR